MRSNGPLLYRLVITPKFRPIRQVIIELPGLSLPQAYDRLQREVERYNGEAGGRIEESLGDGVWHYAGGIKYRVLSAYKSGKGLRG